MALRVEGKVAIVTGAGSVGEGIGNGKAAAILYAREGAKVLLADPDLSLHEVAARLGYTEQTSFSRVFRRITQITPGAYRALYRR